MRIKNPTNIMSHLDYVVWDIVSGKNVNSRTCAASELTSEPYVNQLNIGDPI